MRNLRNIRYGSWHHNSSITAACWDPARDEALFTIGPTDLDSSLTLVRVTEDSSRTQCSHKVVTSWHVPGRSPDADGVDKVVSLHHFSDTHTTCVILAGGDIITVEEEPDGGLQQHSPRIEVVGSIDATITAAAWSPDSELLLATTEANTVIIMGRSFDPVADAVMVADDLAASKHVSVGWGKKETQFQGRGARALRDPTIPEKVDEGVLSKRDDGSGVTISWRGDGAYVAVNAVERGQRRVVRVYTRDGVLDSASEPVDGLEGSLSWRPAGNLIAGLRRLSDRIDVVFFERNGLRHGHFTLRTDHLSEQSCASIRLAWNSDSTVLAVMLADRVQLWTMGNYHWYLKQEISLPSAFKCLAWHPEKALKLVVTSQGHAFLIEYIFATARGSCVPPLDLGAVAVIDGPTVKLTPFRAANIPPPMSMFELSTDTPVSDVAFGPANSENLYFAVLHTGGVDIYSWEIKDAQGHGRPLHPPKRVHQVLFSNLFPDVDDGLVVPLQICFAEDGKAYVLAGMVHSRQLSVVAELFLTETAATRDPSINPFTGRQLATDTSASTAAQVSVSASASAPVPVPVSAGGEALSCLSGGYMQHHSGRVNSLEKNANPEEEVVGRFPNFMPWFEVVSSRGNDEIAFGLSRNGHLYANTRLLAKNCSSFITTPQHLIFTTGNCYVKFVHLAAAPEELEVPSDDAGDERCRSIERGARLVTAMLTNMSLVLQMPRGNLETIFPRAMVVEGIRQLVDKKDYASAFSHCRAQRVDMNILYDHRPSQFLQNVSLFLDQIRDVAHIDLFLSSLQDEDVTQTAYKDTKSAAAAIQDKEQAVADPSHVSGSKVNKVNRICDAILGGLESRRASNLQNVITANVCKIPPALEDGLNIIAGLMREGESVAERAVEHICFLVDVNRLYETALGLYNLDLSLLIAQQSQRDPREYVPFIQSLHVLPDLRRQFVIDDHLGRREKAAAHLKSLDAFDELRDYTVKHRLYQTALGFYRYDEQRFRDLTLLFAAHLETTSQFKQAGLAYESLQNFAKASSCYRAAGPSCWRECLSTAQQQTPPLSDSALTELASSLVDSLSESKDYASAAAVHADYLNSLDGAVACLCKGYQFAEAIRLVVLRRRADLIAKAVDVGLADSFAGTTEFLADCKSQLQAQIPRIRELRHRAVMDPLAFYEGERPGGADVPDDVSVAATSRLSTNASLFTRYTGKGGGSVGTAKTGTSRATSKNRKREEKKRARGRKGTVYEEEYLVNSVRRLVERVEAAQGDVVRLAAGLVSRAMTERARAVQALADEVVGMCADAVTEVFGNKGGRHDGAQDPDRGGDHYRDDGYRPVGAEAVFQEFPEERGCDLDLPPAITAFEKLSLLGG